MIDYSNLTKPQLDLVFEYCDNDLSKLKPICYSVWGNKGLPKCYYDDLYSDAMNVLLESVITYDPNINTNFKSYLKNNISNSFIEWYRDMFLRAKRNNLELDRDGKIKKDENGNPIIIFNVSVEEPINENATSFIKDVIADNKTIESVFFDECEDGFSLEMQKYLKRLSEMQKNVLYLISAGFTPNDILEELNIDKKQYEDCYRAIHSFRNTSVFFEHRRNRNG